MLTEEQLQEAASILRKRHCSVNGHDFDVLITNSGIPTGIKCNCCGDYWRVFNPVDPPTQLVSTIEPPTTFLPKIP